MELVSSVDVSEREDRYGHWSKLAASFSSAMIALDLLCDALDPLEISSFL